MKYIVPKLEDFNVGFQYEVCITKRYSENDVFTKWIPFTFSTKEEVQQEGKYYYANTVHSIKDITDMLLKNLDKIRAKIN